MACQPHCCRTVREDVPASGIMAGQVRHMGSMQRGPSACLTGEVVSHPPSLCCLQEALLQERQAGPPIVLALHELQAVERT